MIISKNNHSAVVTLVDRVSRLLITAREDLGVTAEEARRLVKRALILVREKAEELRLEEIVDAG